MLHMHKHLTIMQSTRVAFIIATMFFCLSRSLTDPKCDNFEFEFEFEVSTSILIYKDIDLILLVQTSCPCSISVQMSTQQVLVYDPLHFLLLYLNQIILYDILIMSLLHYNHFLLYYHPLCPSYISFTKHYTIVIIC